MLVGLTYDLPEINTRVFSKLETVQLATAVVQISAPLTQFLIVAALLSECTL